MSRILGLGGSGFPPRYIPDKGFGFWKYVPVTTQIYIPRAAITRHGGHYEVDMIAAGLRESNFRQLQAVWGQTPEEGTVLRALLLETTEMRMRWFPNNSKLHRSYRQKRKHW